jgi:hypothetical protein
VIGGVVWFVLLALWQSVSGLRFYFHNAFTS